MRTSCQIPDFSIKYSFYYLEPNHFFFFFKVLKEIFWNNIQIFSPILTYRPFFTMLNLPTSCHNFPSHRESFPLTGRRRGAGWDG